jgi:hypothetical protein
LGRRRQSRILRREAEAIAHKLGANIQSGSKHDRAAVRYKGVLVATFGISRGRKQGHPHIPKQLFVSETQAIELATCSISSEDYFDLIRFKGKLDNGV